MRMAALFLSFLTLAARAQTPDMQPKGAAKYSARANSSPADLPTIYFNHLALVLPKEVYAAIVKSQFLHDQFCSEHEETNSRDGGAYTYSGNYLSGRQTYLELFEAASATPETLPAVVEFGLWADKRTQLPALVEHMREKDPGWNILPVTGTGKDGKEILFYDIVVNTGDRKASLSELMVPTQFKAGDPAQRLEVFLLSPNASLYNRASVSRELDSTDQYQPGKLLNDVIAIEMSATSAEIARAVRAFAAFGLAAAQRADGSAVMDGSEIQIILHPSQDESPRSVILHLALNRPSHRAKDYAFGTQSILSLSDGKTATWSFSLPRH